MQKTVNIEDGVYVLQPMTAGEGLAIQEEVGSGDARKDSIQRTLRTVAASMRKTVDEVKEIPWPHYLQLIDTAMEVNGMKVQAADTGEPQAGASPAA